MCLCVCQVCAREFMYFCCIPTTVFKLTGSQGRGQSK